MNETQRPINMWPLAITAALLIFVCLMLWVAVIAVRTAPGKLELHPYEAGLKYEAVLVARRALAVHGWSADFSVVDSGAPSRKLLRVALTDAEKQPVSSLKGNFEAIRPADGTADQRGGLVMKGAGMYEAEIEFSVPGLWILEVSFDNAGELIKLPDKQILIDIG